jgi:hypothetical protein
MCRRPIFAGVKNIAAEYTTQSEVQVSLVIRGRYVPSFSTANPEFADKKSTFD